MPKSIFYWCQRDAGGPGEDAHWASVGDGWLPLNRKPTIADYDAVAALFEDRVNDDGQTAIVVRYHTRGLQLQFGMKDEDIDRITT